LLMLLQGAGIWRSVASEQGTTVGLRPTALKSKLHLLSVAADRAATQPT
jgi:hypothetical protein